MNGGEGTDLAHRRMLRGMRGKNEGNREFAFKHHSDHGCRQIHQWALKLDCKEKQNIYIAQNLSLQILTGSQRGSNHCGRGIGPTHANCTARGERPWSYVMVPPCAACRDEERGTLLPPWCSSERPRPPSAPSDVCEGCVLRYLTRSPESVTLTKGQESQRSCPWWEETMATESLDPALGPGTVKGHWGESC